MHNDQIDAEVKALCGMYQKMLLVPRPDYGSRLSELTLFLHHSLSPQPSPVLWKAMITKHGGQITDTLDISSLAKVSDGYTAGHLDRAITQVLTERRIQQVHTQ